jgi:hypothetical protein
MKKNWGRIFKQYFMEPIRLLQSKSKFISGCVKDYSKALDCNPAVPVKNCVLFRMAMVYSLMNNIIESGKWLIQATMTGFNSLSGLDSFPEFLNLRASGNFKEIRQKVYETIYPCSREPRNRDFDFWIGDWNCYRTGTQILTGSSHVGVMAGGYETTNPAGEKQKGNFIFYFINRDSVRQYQDVTDNTGKTISVTYNSIYLRKNK